ncbi:probable 3-hydroxyisobutyrate dehydrogenase [Arthrobacter sp. Hiyo6]|nr:probable 3-hydroxyisobutyrate dehydrogenase [Arthrobacter sp. Hiyo6]
MAVVGWIGLGNMGGSMSANLAKAGHEVRGFDLNPEAVAAAEAGGVKPVGSIAEAVHGADVVFTMLPKGEHARAVYLATAGPGERRYPHAPGGLLHHRHRVGTGTARRRQRRRLPLCGRPGVRGNERSQGRDPDIHDRRRSGRVAEATEYIKPMAANIIPTGGATTGQAAKICNNLMLFINLAATAEGAVLADRLGLDKQVFWDIASVSSGDSWALRTWYPVAGVVPTAASNNDFAPTFTTELANKDIGLAISAARDTGIPLEIGQHVQQLFQRLIDSGQSGKDCSMIIKLVDGSLESAG